MRYVWVIVGLGLLGCQMTGDQTPSLYERLGGEPAIRAVIEKFVARAAANPAVNFTRAGTPAEWEATPEKIAHLQDLLVEFVAEATGGPQKYSGRGMAAAHDNMQINDAEFDAIAADLQAVLEEMQVPAQESQELLEIVGSTRRAIVEVR